MFGRASSAANGSQVIAVTDDSTRTRRGYSRSGSDRDALGDGDERRDDLAEPLAGFLVGQAPVGVEARMRERNREVALDDAGAGACEHLTQLRLRPDRAEHAGAGADDRGRLVADRRCGLRPRCPVDRVLQLTRNGRVVLRGREEEGIGAGDRVVELDDARRRLLALVVLVERRHRLEPVPELDPDAGRGELRSCAKQLGVERVVPEAAGDREDLHSYDAFTNCRSVTMRTSFARAGSPLGSGLFQLTPNSVRSTAAARRRPMRSLPHGSASGAVAVPVTSTGRATPLIVISPRAVTSLSLMSTSSATKR